MLNIKDLEKEIDPKSVKLIEKTMIEKVKFANKPIIISSSILSSMNESNKPTIEETMNIKKLVQLGTDCLMLTSET